MITTSTPIFDFNKDSNITNWRIVDDIVMGGRSDGNFSISKDGHGIFEGKVSIENNGGFSSVRYRFAPIDVSKSKKICIRLKGDGKSYQFRIKASQNDYYSYISYFETNKEWQTIEINIEDMYPTFRGRKLNASNFDKENIEELAFLIGNKKAETFRLEIDSIFLK